MTDVVVVDNSALIEVVAGIDTAVGRTADQNLLQRLAMSAGCAPEVIDAEALAVLRRMALRGDLTDEQATTAMRRVAEAPIRRFAHLPLLSDAWRMRHSVGGADALYVALAEKLEVPLITCDARLAGSNGHRAKIELFPAS